MIDESIKPNLKAALWYARHGFSVVPCSPPTRDEEGKDVKKPRIPWTEFEKRRATEDEVKEWFEKWPNSRVGIITGAISNIFVVDVDNEEAHQKLESEYLPENLILPKAMSPRGGYHYYFQHQDGLRNKQKIDGMSLDTRGEGGFIMAPPSNGLNGKGYRWVKGLELWTVQPPPLPNSLFLLFNSISKDYITKYIPGQHDPANITPTLVPTFANIDFKKGSRDASLFHVANCLAKGGMPEEEIEQFLILVGNKICSPPFPEKEILEKVKSALKRSDTQERNLTQEVRDLICQHSGNITPTFCQQNLEIANIRQHRNKICTILGRLEKEGLLKRTGSKAGEYKIIKKTFDWVDANEVQQGEYLKLSLPFFLESYVNIEPGNLIVFAGASNAGKSALMLNMIRQNMDKYECWYFSSEMSRQTVRRRINKYDPSPKWNFKIVDKWDFNIDILQPDAFNFCDFLDETEGEAYRISGILTEIQQKMQKGIAVVAIQKKSTSEYGKGGESTINQASLYITIDREQYGARLKIKKAKDFGENNPNEWVMKFNTIKGINLVQRVSWGPEMEGTK